MQKESGLTRGTRSALIAGAVAATGLTMAAPAASADTISIDGLGQFDVPDGLGQFADMLNGAGASGGDLNPLDHDRSVGQRALAAAQTKVGSPYVYGASGPSAFDCSGLVHWAYQQVGVDLPRVSNAQGQVGHEVSMDDLRPGDILMWHGGGHVALYAGDGQVLHAYTTGQPVTYAPLDPSSVATARRL